MHFPLIVNLFFFQNEDLTSKKDEKLENKDEAANLPTEEEEHTVDSGKKTLPKVQQNLTKINVEPEFLEEDIKKVEELEGKDDSDLEAEAKGSEGEEEKEVEEEKEGQEKIRSRAKKVKKGRGRAKVEESCSDEGTLTTEQEGIESVSERLRPSEEGAEDVEGRKGRKRKMADVEKTQVARSTSGKFTVVEDSGQQKKKKTGFLICVIKMWLNFFPPNFM